MTSVPADGGAYTIAQARMQAEQAALTAEAERSALAGREANEVPADGGAAEGGAVLGEEIEAVVRAAVVDWNTLGTGKVYASVSAVIAERVTEHVAALVAQARATAEDETKAARRTLAKVEGWLAQERGRREAAEAALAQARADGAAEERERISAAIERDAEDIASGIAEDEYVHGIYDGLQRGANFARSTS